MGRALRFLLVAFVAGCLPDTSDFSMADSGRPDGSIDDAGTDAAVDGGQDMFVPQSCETEGDCRSPRNECQDVQGECTGGECVYETRVGEGCDDANPCTTGDVCQAAGCLGEPVVCTAPEPRCEGDALVTSTGGRCEGGACVFDESSETCPLGCSAGACEEDVCVPMDWTLTDIEAAAALDSVPDADHRTDGSGADHAVYVAADGVHYLHRPRGGAWTDQLVEAPMPAGARQRDPQLGFDAAGTPLVAFSRWNDEVALAVRSGGGWAIETVGPGSVPAVTGTPDGSIHLVYENGGLQHAIRPSGATEWTISPIRRTDGGFTRAARADTLRLLSTGPTLHLVFTDFAEDDLSYGRFTTEWSLETVYPALVLPSAFDATVDGAGGVHVSFSDDAGGDLHYAYRAAGAAGWDAPRVVHDDVNPVGDPNAIAVTGAGAIHIVYRDENRRDVRYAWRPASGTFAHAALEPDNGFAAGAYADDAGRVRFVYVAVPPVGSEVLRVAEVRECP